MPTTSISVILKEQLRSLDGGFSPPASLSVRSHSGISCLSHGEHVSMNPEPLPESAPCLLYPPVQNTSLYFTLARGSAIIGATVSRHFG